MSDPLISVLLPTVKGREAFLEKAIAAYEKHANSQVIVLHDLPGCGPAWVEAAKQAEGDYLLPGADDVEMHANWWRRAVTYCDRGYLPAARILNTDGSLQSCGEWGVELAEGAVTDFTRSPFVSRAQWDTLKPLLEPFLVQAHYWTDNIFTWAGRKHGMETVVCRTFEYTHHMAPSVDRENGRMQHDHRLYLEYIQARA